MGTVGCRTIQTLTTRTQQTALLLYGFEIAVNRLTKARWQGKEERGIEAEEDD